MKNCFVILWILLAGACAGKHTYPTVGEIEKLDPSLDSILSPNATAEIIAGGLDWSEGPLWIEEKQLLLFSDVPQNTIYQWTETGGKKVYLSPSGYTGNIKRGGETGSNGLTINPEGRLVLCQHGNRQVAFMNAPLDKPAADFITVAGNYNGKRFNSPNDVVYNKAGEAFFTDPPYGLEKNMEDSQKEIPFQGVYKVTKKGEVILLVDSLTRPNGIILMPGERTLLVANSDPAKPNWYAFDITDSGRLANGRIFWSAAGYDQTLKGLPDGMKADRAGNIFATGPGGIWIFNNRGVLAGKIRLPEATSNCALSANEKILYITNDMNVVRLTLRP